MKKLIFICILALSTLGCTSNINTTLSGKSYDETTELILNTADSTVLRSCVVVDEKVIVFPSNGNDDVLIVKNYEPGIIFIIGLCVGMIIGAIIAVISKE